MNMEDALKKLAEHNCKLLQYNSFLKEELARRENIEKCLIANINSLRSMLRIAPLQYPHQAKKRMKTKEYDAQFLKEHGIKW